MKLYTKEMFLIAAAKCEVSMADAKHIMQYIDEYVTPIELPSDEEIEAEALCYDGRHVLVAEFLRAAFIGGAKWARDKILNK